MVDRKPDTILQEFLISNNEKTGPFLWLIDDYPRRKTMEKQILEMNAELETPVPTGKQKGTFYDLLDKPEGYILYDGIGICPCVEAVLNLNDMTPLFL